MSRFLFFLYRLLLDFIYIVISPFLNFILPKSENKQRLGFLTPELKNIIWIHAASVGEVNACKELVKELLERHPDRDILLTTTSTTGMKTAQQIDKHLYTHLLPLDIPRIMTKFIKTLNPCIVVLIETEIWPVMLDQLQRHKIPVILVNARISDKSYPKYKRMNLLWKVIQPFITQINAQSELDADRFRFLGFKDVKNAGNLKFALKLPDYKRNELRSAWNIPEDAFVIVFGSSRPGEEVMLRDVIPALRKKIPNLYIILVPRHLNRMEEIKTIYSTVEYELYSEQNHLKPVLLDSVNAEPLSKVRMCIVDQMGVLVETYAMADLAIIGGSFYDFGGHNPLEAAFYRLPIIMGNYYSSCRDSVAKLQEEKAIKISSINSFAEDIIDIAQNEELRISMGNAGKSVIDMYSHSLEINLKTIEKWI